MGRNRATRLHEVRPVQLFAMNPGDLADAVGLVRRCQLDIIRRHNRRNARSPWAAGQAGCPAGLLLGSLIAALGFDPEANDQAELDAGLGADRCRAYIGIAA